MAGKQLIDTCFGGRYSEAQMGELPGRRTRQGKLKGADVAQADAAVDLKISQREKQTSRKAPTFDAIRARQLKLSSAPTKHEAELMVVAAVCDNDRRRAVASELKFTGQVGRAINYFLCEDERSGNSTASSNSTAAGFQWGEARPWGED